VVRVYDLLLEQQLEMCENDSADRAPVDRNARREARDLRAVASHPMALAQCERFFSGVRN